MNTRFFKYIFLLLLFFTVLTRASAQNIQVSAGVSQQTIRIGEQVKLRLIVHQPVKQQVNFPKLADTIVSKLQVVGTVKVDTVADPQDKTQATVTQTYIITSFDAGTYTIPAYSFGTSTGVLKSNEVTMQVQTVKVDTTKGIYDIKQPLKVTYTIWDWLRDNWYWVAIPLAVLLVAAGLIVYFKTRPKKEVVVEVPKYTIPAHTEAINKLMELREKKLWQQDEVKQYYIELSDILREYLERRYVIKTHEKTTDEIFSGLRHISITEENKATLRQILILSDLVKFAKEKPIPAENVQSMDDAISFVLKTKQEEPKENIGGGKADGAV